MKEYLRAIGSPREKVEAISSCAVRWRYICASKQSYLSSIHGSDEVNRNAPRNLSLVVRLDLAFDC